MRSYEEDAPRRNRACSADDALLGKRDEPALAPEHFSNAVQRALPRLFLPRIAPRPAAERVFCDPALDVAVHALEVGLLPPGEARVAQGRLGQVLVGREEVRAERRERERRERRRERGVERGGSGRRVRREGRQPVVRVEPVEGLRRVR